ncbi:hypothetical protein K435DRAFT_972404 [Dendrothele bispora CBS 962.96]|uniref:Uncharacterized protein n=1 Tax=Dendrothele bispora (strain CBS 962.96) TaxID=1314807 RepID=A0A4S8KZC0_DENBC|nr:hypothetical protein K435DRAFT_972404 [Dendrothele bispora CBS 962.96]
MAISSMPSRVGSPKAHLVSFLSVETGSLEDNQLEPFLSVEASITEPLSTLSLMFFIYGIYVMIFGQCMRALYRSPNRPNTRFYLIGSVTLFVLGTIRNVAEAWLIARQAVMYHKAARTGVTDELVGYLVNGDTIQVVQVAILDILQIALNVTADSMLIHRCYVIWGSQKRIGLPLIILSFMINGLGLAINLIDIAETSHRELSYLRPIDLTMSNVFDISNAVVNSFLTLMTAGRIWWISRQARPMLETERVKKYNTIVAVILESGIIYPLALIIDACVVFTVDSSINGVVPIVTTPLVWQAAGIAPTLIIARARSENSFDSSVGQILSSGNGTSLRFAGMSTSGDIPQGEVQSRGRRAVTFGNMRRGWGRDGERGDES